MIIVIFTLQCDGWSVCFSVPLSMYCIKMARYVIKHSHHLVCYYHHSSFLHQTFYIWCKIKFSRDLAIFSKLHKMCIWLLFNTNDVLSIKWRHYSCSCNLESCWVTFKRSFLLLETPGPLFWEMQHISHDMSLSQYSKKFVWATISTVVFESNVICGHVSSQFINPRQSAFIFITK